MHRQAVPHVSQSLRVPLWPAEETAKVRAAGFVPKVGTFVERVMHLYDGTSMPASDVRFLPSAS